MKIAVWTDIACPYCCIGGVRLRRALRELGAEGLFEIELKSYQLEPELEGKGRPSLQHYADKMGVEVEDLMEGIGRIVHLAAEEGLEFCFDRVLAANTFDAHRLLKHAAARGAAEDMMARLFAACFRDGLDVGDRGVLAGLAADAGLDAGEVRAVLDSDAWAAEVDGDEAEARSRGIRLVPHYLVGGRYSVSGAMTTAYFKDVLMKAIEEERLEEPPPGGGAACGPEGCAWR